MKKFSIIFLLLFFVNANLFAQADSSFSKLPVSVKSLHNNIQQKPIKKISTRKTSDEKSGMLIGAAVGAGAGVLLGVIAGSISMEPHSDNSVPFGTLVVAGVAGAFVGAIIGGVASK